VDVSHLSPQTTLLEFLRDERRLTGTKEGCAEGDCGACTVLVGRLTPDGLVYEGVNSCIRFLGSLDGTHVVTVEHLAPASGKLHPVQQALVDFHGSQCGFCTPGFVISLYALWMQEPNPSEQRIEKALQGNLCRCTGYEPIVRAAHAISSYADARNDPLATERAEITSRLKAMRDGTCVKIGTDTKHFYVPASLEDLADILDAEPKARIVAGATDVGLWVTKFMREIAPVVFIGHLDELRRTSEKDHVLTIGAGVSYTETFKLLAGRVPSLSDLIDRIGA
jgi:xanthine dehydrogenase small subunit